MDAKEFTTKQICLMELASMSSLDMDDAEQELLKRGVREPSFDECFDMLSSMRHIFSKIFHEELRNYAEAV
jgi:hypothetical protein